MHHAVVVGDRAHPARIPLYVGCSRHGSPREVDFETRLTRPHAAGYPAYVLPAGLPATPLFMGGSGGPERGVDTTRSCPNMSARTPSSGLLRRARRFDQ